MVKSSFGSVFKEASRAQGKGAGISASVSGFGRGTLAAGACAGALEGTMRRGSAAAAAVLKLQGQSTRSRATKRAASTTTSPGKIQQNGFEKRRPGVTRGLPRQPSPRAASREPPAPGSGSVAGAAGPAAPPPPDP